MFRAGSPTPIYETREVLVADVFESSNDGFDTAVLENNALYYAVRMLIRDWQKLSETLRAAAS